MMRLLITSFAIVYLGFPGVYSVPVEPSLGDPLFLTQYIKDGYVSKGREAARVPSLIEGEDVESYAGYLTVNEEHNSNLFFWFFPAENNPGKAPVVLWLQGGPGASSLYGLFTENGPFYVESDLTLKRRSHYWSQEFNLIFIDNPVGTGYSFTNDNRGYATDETQVGDELYSAMYQFYQLFPELRDNAFIISGESYAGKYIPALGYSIHTKNPTAKFKINLQGLSIGDGWVDPVNMYDYSDYLYQIGLIDDKNRADMKVHETNCKKLLTEEKYYEGALECGNILGIYYNVSGIVDVYNYARESVSEQLDLTTPFVKLPKVRQSLHVGNNTYNDGGIVGSLLYNDTVKSVAPWLEVLMDNYRVLLYNGQLDVIVPYPLTINMVKNLKWSGAKQYASATRNVWKVDGEPAGFFKTTGNFTEVVVRNAGHMVPADQPIWALDLITRFAFNVSLDAKSVG